MTEEQRDALGRALGAAFEGFDEQTAAMGPMLTAVAPWRAPDATSEADDPRVEGLIDLWRAARERWRTAPRVTRAMMGACARPKVGEDAIKSRLRAADVTLADIAGWAAESRSDSPDRHP
jgi:hypothetical protein